MGLKETMNTMRKLLAEINVDLEKSANGNKAASQRVRVHTIDLEKVAKIYRKESVASERKLAGKAKPSSSKKPAAKKATAKVPKKKK
ncbi:MAG: histone [Chlamydiales bacterium]|nr:histone [Chlamydiales bacterium]